MVFSVILAVVLNNVGFTSKTHPSLVFLFREWRFPAQGDFIIFLSLGLIAAAGFYFLSQAYRLAKPSMIAPFEYVAVPLSIIWGYLVWRDVLEFQAIIGMVLIVGSGLYMFLGKRGFSNRYILSLFKIEFRR
jgi:drug/metabolite transporter (DMT)-like permease